jgi:hypothetical protein
MNSSNTADLERERTDIQRELGRIGNRVLNLSRWVEFDDDENNDRLAAIAQKIGCAGAALGEVKQ